MIDGWEVVFWDVGQGDATTIKLPDGSYILIDAGPATQKGNPLPGWFRRMGEPPIKLAVVTHSHMDHFRRVDLTLQRRWTAHRSDRHSQRCRTWKSNSTAKGHANAQGCGDGSALA